MLTLITLLLLSKLMYGQNCIRFDSLLRTGRKFFIDQRSGITAGDLTTIPLKHDHPDTGKAIYSRRLIDHAIAEVSWTTKNRFNIISHAFTYQEAQRTVLTFLVEEYRKDTVSMLLEDYETTNCPSWFKCVNRAYFVVGKHDKVTFLRWMFD